MTEPLFAGSPELALQFSLPYHRGEEGILIERTSEGLQLRDVREFAPGPLRADYHSDDVKRRMRAGRKLPIARAVGIKSGDAFPTVLDATAGLGRDAYTLAALGCEVMAIERSPIIAAMTRDGLERVKGQIADRVQLIVGDSEEVMDSLDEEDRPDVVYLDPMFPGRSKSAQVKKEMQYFKALFGDGTDSARMFAPAMKCARNRVVVKRPAKGEPLVETPKVNHTIEGKTVRFDVYVP